MRTDNSQKFKLPNLISFLALFISWIAILFLLNGRFYFSFSLALLAFIFDALDGYLARSLGQESPLGRQLDGFVDVFVFLVYPALAFYLFFGLRDPISIIIIFIYIAAGIFRLARFSLIGFIASSGHGQVAYAGLPVFCNHITILVLLALRHWLGEYFCFAAYNIIILNSYLMVQRFRFPKPRTLWPFILLISLAALTMSWMELYGMY